MSSPEIKSGRLFLLPNLLGVVPATDVLPAATIETARSLRSFVVENAKPARAFLGALGMPVPVRELAIEELGPAPDRARCAALLDATRGGTDVGLLSDAGCPAVADPGALLVAAAHDAGVRVIPLVGPSAILLSLMASGLNGQAFCFHGYLPVEREARRTRLRALDDAMHRDGATQLFIETPYRNDTMLAALLETCRPATRLAVAMDLTTPDERVESRSIAAWKRSAHAPLGKRPAMFLIGR